jgi:hypothetical protein
MKLKTEVILKHEQFPNVFVQNIEVIYPFPETRMGIDGMPMFSEIKVTYRMPVDDVARFQRVLMERKL